MSSKNETTIIAREGTQDILVSREFDATREEIFQAFTDPSIYAQWIGPRGFKTLIRRYEAKQGGSWSFTQRDGAGKEYRFNGVFHEITRPFRIVSTFEFEGPPIENSFLTLEIGTFEVLPYGRTLYSGQSIFQSERTRDNELKAGMRQGIVESYERLDALLEVQAAQYELRL